MNEEAEAVAVEVFLQDGRLSGIYRQLRSRLRLVDMLNAEEETLELEDVRIWLGAQSNPMSCPSMSLTKQKILAAIPHEPEEMKRKAALTNVLNPRPRNRADVTLILPPIAVEGMAHLAVGAGSIGLRNFAKFFPVTAAAVHVAGEPSRQDGVVLVSRDNIVSYSIRPAPMLRAV